MSMEVYDFNRQFRIKILSLLLSNTWVARHGDLIKPEYFEQDDEEDVARAILEYRRKFNRAPTDPIDVLTLTSGEHEDFIFDLYEEADEYDTALAGDVAIVFAKEQAVKLAILESIDDVQKGRLAGIVPRMEDALRTGDSLLSSGIDVVRDTDKWLFSVWTDKVQTGWTHMDTVLEGGTGPGELGVVMGPTNAGKSTALLNIGYNAATIGSGLNVVHFTHEMSPSVVAKRYAARMLFRFPRRDEDLLKYEAELHAAARKLLPGRIRVIGGAEKMSVYDVKSHLEKLRAEEFDFGLVIDDYGDLLVPPKSYSDRRFELSATYEYLRALAGEFDVPMWTATQSTRSSYTKEVVTLQDVSEDIGKVQIADVVIALCQTREEYDAEQCRLFLAKVRDGKRNAMFDAKYYGDSQAIITTGITREREDEA